MKKSIVTKMVCAVLTAGMIVSFSGCGSSNSSVKSDEVLEATNEVAAEDTANDLPNDEENNSEENNEEKEQHEAEAAKEQTAADAAADAETAPADSSTESSADASENTNSQQADSTTPAPQQAAAPMITTEYRNDSNCAITPNCVNINSKHVWYQDGMLYAECFVTNGLPNTAYNIYVDAIEISNGSSVIAYDGFGQLEGAVIAPNSYIVWTFVFPADSVALQNADLSYLAVRSSTYYNY